jgi:hypothetical protein
MNVDFREATSSNARGDKGCRQVVSNEALSPQLTEIVARETSGQNGRLVTTRRKKPRPRRRWQFAGPKRRRSERRAFSPADIVVGMIAGLSDAGEPLVRFPLDASGRVVLARTTVPITPKDVDAEVVIAFESGDISKPIVMGIRWQPDDRSGAGRTVPPTTLFRPIVQASLDGERLVLTGENEIVLRCGQASITLTRAGKVLIRGAYLLSRSSGVNRIKGGSVQIN